MESAEYYEYAEGEEYDQEEQWDEGEGGAWGEIALAPVFTGDIADAPAVLRFDAAEEALWTGTAAGVVAQALCPDLARHAQVAAHHDGIITMRSAGSSVVSLSPSQLSVHLSGCVPRVWHADTIGDLAAVEFEPRGHRVLMGRSGGGITSFDMVSGRPGGTIDTRGHGVVALCGPLHRGAIVMGTVDGTLALLDARNSLRQEATLQAHSGGFAAVDAAGDFIATAGYVGRHGRVTLEPTIKVFDVRMGLRMLANLPFAAGPTMLRFSPADPNTLLAAAATGMFTLTDPTGMSGGEVYCVDTGGDAIVCCDVSPTGEVLAFGGEGGYVHLWAASDEPSASLSGEIPTGAEPPEHEPPSLREEDPLSAVPLPFPPDSMGYASDVGPRDTASVGLPPRTVDSSLMAASKQVEFVAHIENPNLIRGGRPGQSAAAVARLRNTRLRARPEAEDAEVARAARAAARAAAGGVVLPGRYRRVAAKQQTGAKFEEFDFSYFNKTPFSGLENDLANCYVNALLQVLFFCRPVRDLAMTHAPSPEAEFSLIGELSLLFRMLATSGGAVCQAANLLRALRQSKEALALGLLEGVRGERGSTDIEVEAQKDKSLGRRAQRLSRFIMEQLSKETAAVAASSGGGGSTASGDPNQQQLGPFEEIFAIPQRQRTHCLSRPRPDQEKATRALQVDLQYPSIKERPPMAAVDGPNPLMAPGRPPSGGTPTGASAAAAARPSFSDVLEASLHTVQDMRAWFDEVVSYQMVRQERCPTALPQVLAVNCGLEDRGDLAWWQPVPVEKEEKKEKEGGDGDADGGSSGPAMRPWLPMAVAVTADPATWTVSVVEGASAADLEARLAAQGASTPPPGAMRALYELTAVVAHVVDADVAAEAGPDHEGHLLAHIAVPVTYYGAQTESPMASRPGSTGPDLAAQQAQQEGGDEGEPGTPPSPAAIAAAGEAAKGEAVPATPAEAVRPGAPGAGAETALQRRRKWLLFNDFHIAPCLPEEVTEIYAGQKAPVILIFTRVEELAAAALEPPAPPAPVLSPDGFLSLCRAPPLQAHRARLARPTFVPLGPAELPRPGQLFALDAEFVQYSPPERVVRRGVEVEARPPRLGLGRVSVVRGDGPSAGVTAIDDYIRSVEPVYDYLTRFSGLVHGDLDPGQSRHHLTTLRRAYLKLRYLVDAGVVFVGHGLKKDFRMLNIVVPPEQVVDTVDLFHSGRRRLSLRFLAAYLLGASIQGGAHDSVEDALAALRLYDAYKRLVSEGKFESVLAEMYDWGGVHGWDPTGWTTPPPHLAAAAQAKVAAQAQAAAQQQEAAAAAVAARQAHQMQALQQIQGQIQQQQRRQQLAVALQQRLAAAQQQQQQQGQGGSGSGGAAPVWQPRGLQ